MAAGGLSPSLQPAEVEQIASRLADDPLLRLPGSLTQTRSSADSRCARSEYLAALLSRDPGVFLERHGELLPASDLSMFQRLRTDYEVSLRRNNCDCLPRLVCLLRLL